jgi:hypothetical protein
VVKSCERAAELTSASYDRKLRPAEIFGLWVHRALCPPCRAYRRQMNKLREHIHELGDAPPREHALDESAKQRIRERLAARKSPE